MTDDDEMTPTECHENCIHADACSRAALRISGVTMVGADRLADALGCGDCEDYDDGAWMTRKCRDRIDALCTACVALVQRCRVGEATADVELIDARFARELAALGIEVGDE